MAALALRYAGVPSPLSWLAAAITLVKTVLIAAVIGAAAIGAVRWLWAGRRR